MSVPTTASLVDVLTPIWQRVLGRPAIGVDDDFFDLGGGGLLAVKLMEEVSQACGRELRPTTICESPTIRNFAALLAKPPLPELLPLVPMRPGAEKPPVFLMHGMGGTVIDFVPLARCLQGKQPVYGLEARGNDGREEPFERIEEGGRVLARCGQTVAAEGALLSDRVLTRRYGHAGDGATLASERGTGCAVGHAGFVPASPAFVG